jgi:hypothetical protein
VILRRFTQHVKEQNWFAVWIDVLVVVVGIFLGLQVTDWNESRKERNVELRYMERLLESSERNISILDDAISTNQALLALQIDTYRLQTKVNLSPEEEDRLRKNAMAMAFWRAVTLDSGLIDTLTTSGDLKILRSEQIQDGLTELRAGIRDLDRQMEYFRGWWLEILESQIREGELIASFESGGTVFASGLSPEEVMLSLKHYSLSADVPYLQDKNMISRSVTMLAPRTNFLGSLRILREKFVALQNVLQEESGY